MSQIDKCICLKLEMCLPQIAKYICLKLWNILVSNCQIHSSQIIKCICHKEQNVFVSNCKIYLSQLVVHYAWYHLGSGFVFLTKIFGFVAEIFRISSPELLVVVRSVWWSAWCSLGSGFVFSDLLLKFFQFLYQSGGAQCWWSAWCSLGSGWGGGGGCWWGGAASVRARRPSRQLQPTQKLKKTKKTKRQKSVSVLARRQSSQLHQLKIHDNERG